MSAGGDNDYDAFAAAYAAHNEAGVWNARYERPAILRLAGPVDGLRVLDAGCGAGAHAAALVAGGAMVTGLDASRGLLALAAERLGPGVPLHHVDLQDELPFAAGAFDLVLSALVLHYLEDWAPTLRELRRVLRPGGRLVASVHHPFMDHALSGAPDYFATYAIEEQWEVGGRRVPMRFWHRPLTAITAALTDAGFALESLEEPQPEPVVRELDPVAWAKLTTAPRFLFLAARRAVDGPPIPSTS
ncbi:tRNA methyltransferase [Paraconexibacter sp. AEG42_29]|uniref:tRNA methyltransferase n=1 Tax=Paraconexibacter sp. AEG42_29 TaxID=2997339 RepID=A0AAU7ASI7_9ACTN